MQLGLHIYLVGVHSNWDAKGAGQPKVGNLDAASLVNQQVLRLQVSGNKKVGQKKIQDHTVLILILEVKKFYTVPVLNFSTSHNLCTKEDYR